MLNIYCVIPLTYLFLCALKGLFSLKLSSYYGVYNNQNTDSFSLLFLTRYNYNIEELLLSYWVSLMSELYFDT